MATQPLLQFNAQAIAIAHTVCSASAFLVAFAVGCSLHYLKIVQNADYGYPDEWFPSVSATIGDRYPERSIFQILIALTSGPRFLLLFTNYLHQYKNGPKLATWTLLAGIVRTVTCGGWVYITSTDDHGFHDFCMISYIVLTIPWDTGVTLLTPKSSPIRHYRRNTESLFFLTMFPLVYLFIQHKVKKIPGAYSHYAYFEWSLIFWDIFFDAWSIPDFNKMTVEVRPASDADSYFSAKLITSEKTADHPDVDDEKLAAKSKDDAFVSAATAATLSRSVVDIVNSYMFWTVYSSLYLCIWYFPLWHMGISGYETTAASTFSPLLLVIPPIRHFFLAFPQVSRFLTCALGIGSYLVTEPATRLLIIAGGVVFGCIALACDIISYGQLNNPATIRSYATCFTLGLIGTALGKFAFWTENPIWPIMNAETGGWNKTGLAIGLIAACLTRAPEKAWKKQAPKKDTTFGSIAALGFGALIFSMSALMTDTSTIIRWTWDGFPVHGPMPVPHGALSLVVMCLGAIAGLLRSDRKFLLFSTIQGVVGAVLLYAFRGWAGYIGGMMYTFWLCVLTPAAFDQASRFHAHDGFLLFFSFIFTLVLTLMHVWVVAYAFVPGGPAMRERTDIILYISVAALVAMAFNYVGASISISKIKPVVKRLGNVALLLAVTAGIVAIQRLPVELPQPYHPDSRILTAGIWTIHFALDNDMWASQTRMSAAMKDLEVDVFGLLESDTERIIMGNRDLTERMAEELHMYTDYGPGPNQHTWGCALFSKFPIMNSTHYLMPSPVGELACAIHATLDCYGEPIDVVVFHSGQEEDVEDRRQQSNKLAEIMGSSDRPMVLMSYLVTKPLQGNYNTFVSEKSGMHDIDPSDDDRWCEYILYKHMRRIAYARVSRSTITDTEIQSGKFIIPKSTDDYDETYSQHRIDESSVPDDMKYPKKFYGEGVRGHHYHVFDEPKYFDLN